jgi:hypothetical protein
LSRPFRHSLSVEVLVVAVILLGGLAAVSHGQSVGLSWSSTTNLPTRLGQESCVTNSNYGYVFCIGGLTTPTGAYTNEVQFGTFSQSGGIASWNTTTIYPFPSDGQSCTTYALSVICVGGSRENVVLGTTTITNSVYSAPILISGLGSWTPETSYPLNVTLESCIASSGYIDCIGGTNGLRENSSVYYSPLTLSGDTGAWVQTASYPISVNSPSCVAVSGYVYCVGGAAGASGYSDVYYAPLLSSGGVGAWAKTTSYPTTVYSHSCAASASNIYCVGGYANKQYTNAVYYAPLLATGLGAWTQASNYPIRVELLSCVMYSSALYCFGGYDTSTMSNLVYYTPISPFQLATTTVTTISTVTSPTTSTVTSTSTVRATTTVTSSVTSTSTLISLSTTFRTSTVTSTTQNVSTTTATHTISLTNTTTITETIQTQAPVTGTVYLVEAGPAVVGLAAGVVLTFLFSRLRRGGKASASSVAGEKGVSALTKSA